LQKFAFGIFAKKDVAYLRFYYSESYLKLKNLSENEKFSFETNLFGGKSKKSFKGGEMALTSFRKL